MLGHAREVANVLHARAKDMLTEQNREGINEGRL